VALKVGVCPAIGLLSASRRVIMTVEVSTPSARTGPVPIMLEFAGSAAPAVNTTVPPVLETGVKIERVFVSAIPDCIVQVETPEALVTEQAV
jgi:hypothetical protein